MGSWVIDIGSNNWFDPVAGWHTQGSCLSFADGHAEKMKWKDRRTIEWFKNGTLKPPPLADHVGSEDLRYMLKNVVKKRS